MTYNTHAMLMVTQLERDSGQGAYGSLTQGAFQLSGMAGYAYLDDRMKRTIVFPGLVARIAQGQTHADQFFGEIEADYEIRLNSTVARMSVTPFAQVQAIATRQAGLTENGAGDIDLIVAPEQTTSVRGVLGAQFAAVVLEKLALQLRLGWAHEYSDDIRASTAAFAGAPGIPFVVGGAHWPRDSFLIGLNFSAPISKAASFYLRYDGDFTTGAVSNAASFGVRMTW